MTPNYWIVCSKGEIVECEDVFLKEPENPDDPMLKITNHEIRDLQGRFWRPIFGGMAVASDGTLGKFLLSQEQAAAWAGHLHGTAFAIKEESTLGYRESTGEELRLGLMSWVYAATLNGSGTLEELCSLAQMIVRICNGSCKSMAAIVGDLEWVIESMVEKAMKHRNSVVDEMGHAEEIWWAGWDQFKRKEPTP